MFQAIGKIAVYLVVMVIVSMPGIIWYDYSPSYRVANISGMIEGIVLVGMMKLLKWI
jgi:membrane-associated HD superfamily phosphohydrolase